MSVSTSMSGPFEREYVQGNPTPGPGRAAGDIMDQIRSFGGNYQLSWNNRMGLDGPDGH